MSTSEMIWSLGLLAVVCLAFQALQLFRRRTADFRASAEFKARLPAGVRRFETLTLVAIAMAVWPAVGRLYFLFAPSSHALANVRQGAGAAYFAVGTWAIAGPLAMLLANLTSWLLPPIRAANLRAMAGLPLSLWSMNRGLLQFGAVSLPAGLAILAVATLAPWGR